MAIELVKKSVFDSTNAEKLDKSGGTMTGRLTLPKGLSLGERRYIYSLNPINFPVGKYEAEIELTSKDFTGQIEIRLVSGYNNMNAAGTIEKKIDISISENKIEYQNSGYTYAGMRTKAYFMISDVYLKNGKKCIKIIQGSGGNRATCTLTCMGDGFSDLTNSITAPMVSTETFITPAAIHIQEMNALVEKKEITFPFASGYSVVGSYKSGITKMLNRICVYVSCAPNSGSFAEGATIATLPVGYRPSARICGLFRDTSSSTATGVPYLLNTDGTLVLRQGDYTCTQLSGVIIYDI